MKKKARFPKITLPHLSSKQKILLIVAVAAGLLFAGRSLFIAATVNGMPIFRLTLIQELEKQWGKTMLETLITQTLIEQAIKKEGITISDEEAQNEIERIKNTLSKQGQNLDVLLDLQRISKEDFQKQVRIQLAIEKLLGKDIKITPEEIDEYIKQNKSLLVAQKKDAQQKEAEERIRSEKLLEKYQEWINNLREKAQINYWVNY